MARRDGLFARLDLDYADHPKIAGLSDGAFRAHVEMILYARKYMTDGVIAKQIAKRWPQQALEELLSNDYDSPSLMRTDDGGYLLHGFSDMQETRAEIEAKREVRREAGRKGGLSKVANTKRKPKQAASNLPSNLSSKNVAETETETEIPPISPKGDAMEGFAEFWEVYPRKVARKAAMAKFPKCVKEAGGAQKIIDGAKVYAKSVEGREIEKIAHPTTWLNQGRWDDELTLNLDNERSSGWSKPLPRVNAP